MPTETVKPLCFLIHDRFLGHMFVYCITGYCTGGSSLEICLSYEFKTNVLNLALTKGVQQITLIRACVGVIACTLSRISNRLIYIIKNE